MHVTGAQGSVAALQRTTRTLWRHSPRRVRLCVRGKEQWKRRGQLQEFNNAMHPRHLEVRELAKPPNLPLEERFARGFERYLKTASGRAFAAKHFAPLAEHRR